MHCIGSIQITRDVHGCHMNSHVTTKIPKLFCWILAPIFAVTVSFFLCKITGH